MLPVRLATTKPGKSIASVKVTGARHSGNQLRRHCIDASRATRCKRVTRLWASGRATERSATTGIMLSTPNSVSCRATTSGFAPLVRENATRSGGVNGDSTRTSAVAMRSNLRPDDSTTRYGRHDPEPLAAVTTSPIRRRRTRTK